MRYYDAEYGRPCKGDHGPDECRSCADQAAEAKFYAEERAAHDAELPTDDEVEAMSADLAPLMDEFKAREQAKERERV